MFCASQASTAICLSMDQASCSSSNTIQLGGRAIDRHNPIISESRRSTSKALTAPCSSHPPINPKPYHNNQKDKKNSSSKPNGQNKKKSTKGHDEKKKNLTEKLTEHVTNKYSSKPMDRTPGSTRSLLSETAFLDGLSDYDPVLALTTVDNKKAQIVHQDETNPACKPSSSSPKSGSPDKVVELKVSLHCKGCEGKVRKQLSRMQGVTSFNINYKSKKVTVVGDVTPLSVLACISKVKNAQFWPPSASEVGSGIVETEKKKLSN
ncbi:protein SODIUM POTASSIUM ROOT DEFECTIVE 3-like isoform X2 [Gastrolobium bilobum]|uniref:protein SODIUM POTASSIUM ROOT DEFECTIVE 3-like isoform X2 n=1 Tax=Gastrolobium bilobum TaxID=150636 RepID=UPI002AB1C824|nr:protein SODIUM POTASSIUM ROOT DEFECTIVE 3-like isoform X2 [Gastrolobium bilobum]